MPAGGGRRAATPLQQRGRRRDHVHELVDRVQFRRRLSRGPPSSGARRRRNRMHGPGSTPLTGGVRPPPSRRPGSGQGQGRSSLAADSAMACTRPCVVYSRATIETVRPSLRAESAVTGPMHAISASPSTAGRRSSGKAPTKLYTVDELVNVITSTPSLLKRRSSASPAAGGHMAW